MTDSSAGFDVGQYLDQSSHVQAVVGMSGPTDLTVNASSGFTRAVQTAFMGFDLAKASPVTYATRDDPPFLTIQGDQDAILTIRSGEAQELYDCLKAAVVSAQMVVVHGGPHTLDAPDETHSRADLTRMIVDFFSQNLK